MLSVTVDNIPVRANDLEYSSVDPGGFESASFTIDDPNINLYGGQDVRVYEGLETAWQGRVEDPGFRYTESRIQYQVNAVGYGAELKDNFGSMVYIDRDIGNWTTATRQRQIDLLATGYNTQNSPEQLSDTATPALRLGWIGTTATGIKPIVEALYDAGYGNAISQIRADFAWGTNTSPVTDVVWGGFIGLASNDILTIGAESTNVGAALSASGLRLATGVRRYAYFQFYYGAQLVSTGDGQLFNLDFSNIRIIGAHALQLHGGDAITEGFYISDIVRDIVERSGAGFDTTAIQANTFIVNNLAYRDKTDYESQIEDMRKLSGWHWGVWEPVSPLSARPSFWFNGPNRTNRSVGAETCEELDLTSSFSSTFDKSLIAYSDVTGAKKYATFSLPNEIPFNKDHTLELDIGTSTDDAAAAIASYILIISNQANSGSGSCVLPARLDDGTYSHLLRPGRDNIQIRNLKTSRLTLLDSNDRYRLRRMTVSVVDGTPRTTVEFDRGADLVEVLQARLAQGNSSIGF